MKIHPEDPRLTAYATGELGEKEAAEVERAVAADPALRAELAEINATRASLAENLAYPSTKLLPAQKDEVLRLARKIALKEGAASAPSWKSKFQAWLIPSAAAAVLAIATVILTRMPSDAPAGEETTKGPSKPAAPATPDAVPPAPAPAVVFRTPNTGMLSPNRISRLELPIQKEADGMAKIAKPIREGSQLPPRDQVHLEEILNSFPIRLNGTTSISRGIPPNWHPDKRSAGVPPLVATLSTEMISSPWKPSAILLFVSVRGNPTQEAEVAVNFLPDPAKVSRYRLLGYTGQGGESSGKVPGRLPTAGATTLVIEIEPSGPPASLGTLEWSTHGEKAPAIQLTFNKEAEPSDDSRFAALVCTYSLWLAGEQSGIIDAEVVSALAREIASTTLPPERMDFLNLIDRSLRL